MFVPNSRRALARRLLSLAVTTSLLVGASVAAAQGTIIAPGLSAPGSITYDAEGVPVIRAASENDAAYLLGYAHARDRFWQLDFNRRGASGTVAELVGPPALANDIQTRTLGLRRAAEATWAALSADSRGWLKAYADGVNQWLANNPLPPEYTALEITRVAPWSPVDSLVIGKALAFQLSFDLDTDFTIRAGAYQQAGTAGGFNGSALFSEDTHRSQGADDRVSIPGFRPTNGAILVDDSKSTVTDALPSIDPEVVALAQQWQDKLRGNPLIEKVLQRNEGTVGSNWWLISGSRTASGRPLIANDPHLGLGTPSIFQEAHIIAGSTVNIRGASLPGTPVIAQGCTPRFCWGSTVNPMDVTDTFTETFVVNTYGLPTHTVYQGRIEPVQTVFQSFVVNRLDGVPDNGARDNSIGYLNGAITVIVPRRNNGPVVSITGNTGLSVQYTGWGATFELESFRRIARAQNLEQFRSALDNFDFGSQNFGYADVEGNIAYFTSAEMPIRDDLQNLNNVDGAPPFLIRDGSGTRRNEWLPVSNPQPGQAVPYEVLGRNEMPFVINPASGYIANANNDPVGTTLDNNPLNQVRPRGGLYYLNPGYSSLRMGRIDRLIQAKLAGTGPVSVADLQAWQANNSPRDAEILLPFLLTAAGNGAAGGAWPELRALASDPAVTAAIARLQAWDFSTPTGIPQGFDPGDDPAALPQPTSGEAANSVAATLYAGWRSQAIRQVIDATLARIGVGSQLPGNNEAVSALAFHLRSFATRRGTGVSGVNFFQVANAPSPEAARDFLLLKSLKDAITLFQGESFAAAFNRSTSLDDLRWGRLHRIVFSHSLGGPFNLPDASALYGFANLSAQLPGLARPGGYEVLDASGHSVRANTVNGFMFGSGPARRKVAEMTDGFVPQQILPGGQSGVLGNPLYASQLGRWLTNRYKPMPLDPAVATASPASVLNFQPRP
jgi:penicillin amidase